ncbi:HD domain-containing protein [Streptococcus massiliensis]|uniref:Putative hydrolase n=1 Tax=Streptococcus massiliensis TaxID=313439 RepID=A0A380KYR1_9STRE|nr:HD domain-containing protein [Streptococcus massiliensis]SUN76224.1 putative hydrolase [Streptococcus massiliensis]
MEKSIIQKAENFVKEQLAGDTTGHDYFHIERVVKMALRIAEEEGADAFICHLAALLHDVADAKLNMSEEAGLAKVRSWLEAQNLPAEAVVSVMDIIVNMSFKAGQAPKKPLTLEGRIVQDADRLDALGAIGIARAMVYSGAKGRPIYDPNLAPRENLTLEEYRSTEGTAIMHFYEKLLKLKERMNTQTGKALAQKRHAFMENYLEQFYAEWEGKR